MEAPEDFRCSDIKLNDQADIRIEWKETKRGRSVHRNADSLQSELDTLMVVVADAIMHTRFQLINAIG